MNLFVWNLLVMFLAALLPIAIYAIRKNWGSVEWRIILTDNFIRIIAAFLLIFIAAFGISFEPSLVEVLTSTIGVGATTSAAIGLGIGSFLVVLLPSDTGAKQAMRE